MAASRFLSGKVTVSDEGASAGAGAGAGGGAGAGAGAGAGGGAGLGVVLWQLISSAPDNSNRAPATAITAILALLFTLIFPNPTYIIKAT